MRSRCTLFTLPAEIRLALALAFVFTLAPVPAVSAEEASGEDPFSGTWDVQGMTTDVKSGDTRRIEGHVVLTRKGDRWAAASELVTKFPTMGGPVHTQVIGTGVGHRDGKGLAGEAHTQLVIQTVPGVDTDFAFIPRQVGPRLVSKWTARFEGGVLFVELSNQPEAGEDYAPTKTVLRGKRVQMPASETPGEPQASGGRGE
jgi:hypothetical protein